MGEKENNYCNQLNEFYARFDKKNFSNEIEALKETLTDEPPILISNSEEKKAFSS